MSSPADSWLLIFCSLPLMYPATCSSICFFFSIAASSKYPTELTRFMGLTGDSGSSSMATPLRKSPSRSSNLPIERLVDERRNFGLAGLYLWKMSSK